MGSNSKNPVISVVIGSYNRYKFLKETIKSVRENGIEVPYEIIVIDGGSTDGTIPWLIKQKDVITIVQHNRGEFMGKKIERRSWGYFMNIAFRSTHGKYILMISDDCLLVPGAVMNGYNLFEEKLSEGEKIGGAAFYWRNWPEDKKYFVIAVNGQIYINHGMYLKDALEEVDYINEEDYMFYCADVDLSLRLVKAGYSIEAIEESTVEHYNHANYQVRKSNRERYQQDDLHFKSNWMDFLGPNPNSSIIKSEIIPNDKIANKSFNSFYRRRKIMRFFCMNLSLLYHFCETKLLVFINNSISINLKRLK